MVKKFLFRCKFTLTTTLRTQVLLSFMETSDVLAEIAFEVKPAWAKLKRTVECVPHFAVDRGMTLEKSSASEFFIADLTFKETAIRGSIF